MRRDPRILPISTLAVSFILAFLFWSLILGPALVPVFGHVRYILNQSEINQAEANQPPDHLMQADTLSFLFLLALLFVVTIQFLGAYLAENSSLKSLTGTLANYSKYVPLILRVFTGIFLIVSGLNLRLLAPEFLFPPGNLTPLIAGLEVVAGMLLMLGLVVKIAALFMVVLLGLSLEVYGLHVLDHLELLGIAAVLITEGGIRYAADGILLGGRKLFSSTGRRLVKLKPFSMPALRITFGISVIWLGLTEKLLAPELTRAAIVKYNLPVFPNVDLFIFLFGAFEIIIGIHYLLGIFLRIISVVYLGLLVFAFFFFGEGISHFSLFAVVISILIRGSGPYALKISFSKEVGQEHKPEEELRRLSPR